MQRKIFNIFLLFLLTFNVIGYTQEALTIDKTITLSSSVDYFEIDQIGNIYQVFKDEIIKLDPNGVELYRYSNKSLGDITQIDLQNNVKSGLSDALKVTKIIKKGVGQVFFDDKDVVRHPLVQKIVKAYERKYVLFGFRK